MGGDGVTEARNWRPFLIGITGNIGTGKSTVAEMLADLGAKVIDADKVAHQVIRPGSETHARVVKAFGSKILTPGGEIDRKKLGAIVFGDPEALKRLEGIVHPATLEVIDRRIAATSADVVVVEAIKLIESGLADRCDSVWVVTCQRDQQIERVVSQRGLSREEVERRVEAQGPQEEKVVRADVVIDNAGSLAATREQVKAAWDRVIGRAGEAPSAAWN
jgi:dephospho-CoA kinase